MFTFVWMDTLRETRKMREEPHSLPLEEAKQQRWKCARLDRVGSPFTRTECVPYVPGMHLLYLYMLSLFRSLALSPPLKAFLHPSWMKTTERILMAFTHTPVARCVTLTKYWHKGGGVCVGGARAHTHEMNYSYQPFPSIQSTLPPPPRPVCQTAYLTFVPALICKKAHCNVTTCRLNLSHSAPVRASFPYHMPCKWLSAAGWLILPDNFGKRSPRILPGLWRENKVHLPPQGKSALRHEETLIKCI